MTPKHNQNGFSLIELMVALVVGLIVVAGVIQIFFGTRMTFNTTEAVARVQENARFALESIKPAVRENDVQGFCASDIEVNNHLNLGCSDNTDLIYGTNSAFLAWDFNGTGPRDEYTLPDDLDPAGIAASQWSSVDNLGTALDLPAVFNGRVVPGSDVFITRRLSVIEGITGLSVLPGQINLADGGGAAASHGLDANALVYVTNCNFGDFFHTSTTGTSFQAGASSCGAVGPGNSGVIFDVSSPTLQVFEVELFGYYVGFNAVRDETGLYRVDLSRGLANAVHEEIVSGVETMQVLAGYSLPAPAGDGQHVDNWLPGDEVPNWEFVIGAQVSLLMSSTDNVDMDEQTQTFELSGVQVTATEDARLRQPFTARFSLRNRQLVAPFGT